MKQGWEIKKLGEVCEIVGGSTPKTSEPSYWEGEYLWVTPAELGASKYVSSTSRTITEEGVKSANLKLLPSGTVLLSSRAPIGKVAIATKPMYCNQGFKNLICSDKLDNEYAYWFLYNNTEYLNSLGTGATFKEISKRVVEQISIPIPPLVEQERIVAELDCLSGVIEKKKQQLKELDALAQSIFYEMFGDPITNEKGWEVKKINEVCKIFGRIGFRGYTTNDLVDSSNDGAISLSPTNIHNGQLTFSKCTYITWYKYEESPEIMIYEGDILLAEDDKGRRFWGMVKVGKSGWDISNSPSPQWDNYMLCHGWGNFPSSLAFATKFKIIGSIGTIKNYDENIHIEHCYQAWILENKDIDMYKVLL
jgi:type I restriction enzyme S subunit